MSRTDFPCEKCGELDWYVYSSNGHTRCRSCRRKLDGHSKREFISDDEWLEKRVYPRLRGTESGCWEWTGATRGEGYGSVAWKGAWYPVHRLIYEDKVGPIPEGLVIDHICHNLPCANPDHLRPITHKQNCENQGRLSKLNKSGYRGVSLQTGGKWAVNVKHNGIRHFGGSYSTPEEANEVAVALRNRLFTHNDLDRTTDAIGDED